MIKRNWRRKVMLPAVLSPTFEDEIKQKLLPKKPHDDIVLTFKEAIRHGRNNYSPNDP